MNESAFKQLLTSILNGRSLFGFIWNFFINFLPVFIWILIFKNAGLIPKRIRPPINVKLPMILDNYIFNINESLFTSILALIIFVFISYLLYINFYRFSNDSNGIIQQHCQLLNADLENVEQQKLSKMCRSYNHWHSSPPLLLCFSWFILNFVYELREPISITKDLIAWFSYVLCHVAAPILTAIWLYIFHPPGALKLFSFALGIQNIAGVLTHLLFPNAPPWFIHYYGENHVANYDILGYAAGLVRVDIALGTCMHTKCFHISPIVFGAIPSIHSSTATLVFFFVSYYARWICLKVVVLGFVILQWWATIYLDHHWRIDLMIGLMYSIVSFTFLTCWKYGLHKIDADFLEAQLKLDFQKGSSMAMRVFKKTRFQNFFDPFFPYLFFSLRSH